MTHRSRFYDGIERAPVKTPVSGSVRGWLSLTLFLGVIFTLSSVLYVWLRIQQIHDGYRLAKLQDEYAQLTSVQRKMRLEWNRLQDPYFLEQLARERFGLNPPGKDQRLLLR